MHTCIFSDDQKSSAMAASISATDDQIQKTVITSQSRSHWWTSTGEGDGLVRANVPGCPLYMVTTAAAAAEPGKLPLRKPPALALPMAVNLTGSWPADKPRELAGCATWREKLAAAKCGSCWSWLSYPINLQGHQVHHSTRWCNMSSQERERQKGSESWVLLSRCLVGLYK